MPISKNKIKFILDDNQELNFFNNNNNMINLDLLYSNNKLPILFQNIPLQKRASQHLKILKFSKWEI